LRPAARYAAILTVNLVLVAVMLVAAEFTYRWIFRGRQSFHTRSYPGQLGNRVITWARIDRDLGWVFSGRNLQTFRRGEAKWEALVNHEGFRAPVNFQKTERRPGERRVMVLGDSFVFGVYLNDPETLPAQLGKQLGPNFTVHNFGMPGWGLDQMYLAYLKYVDAIEPDVVLLSYIDDDVVRTFDAYRWIERLNKPSFDVEDGRLVKRRNGTPGVLDRLSFKSLMASQLYNRFYRRPYSKAIAEALFDRLGQETHRRSQRLIVLRYPTKLEVLEGRAGGEFDFASTLERNQVVSLDPLDEMRACGPQCYRGFYIEDDGHPTGAGNEFVARFLVKQNSAWLRLNKDVRMVR
jgi:hypothetical protein